MNPNAVYSPSAAITSLRLISFLDRICDNFRSLFKSRIRSHSALGCCALIVVLAIAIGNSIADQPTPGDKSTNWPTYRGSDSTSVAHASDLPKSWSETSNVKWKSAIPGRGWSSPIVWGKTIWMTTATPDGLEQSLIGVDIDSGATICNEVVFTNATVQPDYDKSNSYASPTPTTDGEKLFVHFGAYGTACYDIQDRSRPKQLWQRRDLPCNHFRGAGSSPILFENSLIFHMDGFDFHYAVALNKITGETLWKSDRNVDYGSDDGDVMKAFSTPLIIHTKNRVQMISPTAKAVLSLNPIDGSEYWRVRYKEHSSASRPVFDGERVYLNSGFSKGKLLAIDPNGNGDVTSDHVQWEASRGIGNKPSPTVFKDWVFTVEDRGVVTCVAKADGGIAWQKRVGGDFSASPLVSDGHLYCFDENGTGYVFEANGAGTLVSTNLLDDGCKASPIAIGRQLIVRTKSQLYCLELQ
jgi:outer membrane protein assembly factor BamB